MPDLSLVHKPLFGEGCLQSWPQLPGCTGAELLRQTPLNQEGSADFPLPVLVSYARGQCSKAWWRRRALPGRRRSLILRPHVNAGRELSAVWEWSGHIRLSKSGNLGLVACPLTPRLLWYDLEAVIVPVRACFLVCRTGQWCLPGEEMVPADLRSPASTAQAK